MLMLRKLWAQDVGPLKNVEVKVKPGVTYVYGLNQAAGPASKNRNGTGKTVTFGIPRGLLFDENVGGTSGLSFKTNKGRVIEIVSKPKPRGKGEKTWVSVNGEDKTSRTIGETKNTISKLFPLTREEYDTYVHIDSAIPHPLVKGTTAQRQTFFTKFFGLDKIDAERKLYVAELGKLKEVRASFNELRTQFQNQKSNLLADEKVEQLTSLSSKLEKRLANLQEKVSAQQNVVRLIEFATNMKEQIAILKDCLHPAITQETFDEHEDYEKENLVDAEAKLKDARAWDKYKDQSAAFQEAFDALSPTARKYQQALSPEDVEKKLEAAEETLSEAKDRLRDAQRTISKAQARLDQEKVAKVEAPQEEEGDLLTLKKTYEHQIKHAQQFSSGTCETCGQTVDVKDPEILRGRLKKVVAKLRAWEGAQEWAQDQDERKTAVMGLKEAQDVEAELTEIVRKKQKLVIALKAVAALPPEPTPFKGLKLEANVCEQMVTEIKEKLSFLKFMRPHLETVIEFLALGKAERAQAEDASALEAQMYEVQERLTRVNTKLSVHETFREQAATMRKRLVKLRKELQDEEPLQHLVKGYQNKNLKKMAIEAISEHLMALVNRYAQEVMPERFTFSFAWDTQIRMLVHRPNGKTSDVRALSGAESTFFTLVLVCALLAFVPDSKRVNVLILDEPAARLSDELKETFKKLIGILNQLIPSIYVITPHQETFDGAHYLTVVKAKNGESSIVEAHPLTLK